MGLMIDLSPEVQTRLQQEATRRGINKEEYARQLIETHLPDAEGTALSNLMQSWIEEDATDDPEELERREAEWQELKDNLNAHRAATGQRLLFP
jgi:predicted DNA-binding protein